MNLVFGIISHESLFANVNFFRIDTKDEILYDPALASLGQWNLDGKTRAMAWRFH